MKIYKKLFGKSSLPAVIVLLFLVAGILAPATVHATSSTEGAPDQASCNNGSTSFTWDGMGIARPVIASLSVDGEAVADPTNPADGSIGAAICPNVELGRRTGLFVYYRHDSVNDFSLAGAVTPISHAPITASSHITITLSDMGDLAQYYSFSLVHGVVSSWTTAHLGTTSASLSVTLSPVRTPFGNGEDFGFCTATPPNCNANKSDVDAISASLDMTFDQSGYGSIFSGAYFGLTGAMGGWVEAVQASDGTRSLVATLGAPHFLADGTTRNTGSLQAFLPTSVLENLLGLSPGGVDTRTLAVTRTESHSTASAPFTVTPVTGGVVINLSNITFSSPAYTIKKAVLGDSTTAGAPDTGYGTSTSSGTLPIGLFLMGVIVVVIGIRRHRLGS